MSTKWTFLCWSLISTFNYKKCTSNCELENSIYKLYHFKEENGKKICECLQSCKAGQFEYGKECLDDCPSGFYKKSNKCFIKCNSKFYYKNEVTVIYEYKASYDGDIAYFINI